MLPDCRSASGEQRAGVEEFEGTFDLLVSDVVMGEMSGRDLATALQSETPRPARVLVSGTANRSILAELIRTAGIPGEAFKPSDLVDRVHDCSPIAPESDR